jgi:hypothetical protein
VLSADSQPSPHRPTAHLDETRGRGCNGLVRIRGINANHQSPLAARRDGHVAADEEGEPAEHLLFRQGWLAVDQLANASRKSSS